MRINLTLLVLVIALTVAEAVNGLPSWLSTAQLCACAAMFAVGVVTVAPSVRRHGLRDLFSVRLGFGADREHRLRQLIHARPDLTAPLAFVITCELGYSSRYARHLIGRGRPRRSDRAQWNGLEGLLADKRQAWRLQAARIVARDLQRSRLGEGPEMIDQAQAVRADTELELRSWYDELAGTDLLDDEGTVTLRIDRSAAVAVTVEGQPMPERVPVELVLAQAALDTQELGLIVPVRGEVTLGPEGVRLAL